MIFSQEEYNLRVKKVKDSMSSKGIDILISTDPSNMNYLKQHDYIDCFPVRPFNQNIDKLIPVLEFLGINDSVDNLIL